MPRPARLGLLIALALLASWGILTAAGLAVGPEDARDLAGGPLGAAASVCLLVSDVLIPVPATVVMVAQGATFGAVGGALLAWAGLTAAAALAYLAGRGGRRVAGVSDEAAATAPAGRGVLVAIALSRPIPIVAETVMAVAGAQRVAPAPALTAALLGAAPVAALFAGLGSAMTGTGETAVVAAATFALSAVLWRSSVSAVRRRSASAPPASAGRRSTA